MGVDVVCGAVSAKVNRERSGRRISGMNETWLRVPTILRTISSHSTEPRLRGNGMRMHPEPASSRPYLDAASSVQESNVSELLISRSAPEKRTLQTMIDPSMFVVMTYLVSIVTVLVSALLIIHSRVGRFNYISVSTKSDIDRKK